jgi:hypothetical protein
MLELRGQRPVAGYRCPAIIQHLAGIFADIDHRLDGEEHAGAQLRAGAGAAGVDDFGGVVEHLPQTVAAEIADHRIAVGFGVALDRVGDIAHAVARFRLLDAQHHAFIGDLNQLARLDRGLADQIHAAGVAVPAIDDHGHVNIDDIALVELLVAGDAVADNMVDRGAAAVRETAIAERRRDRSGGERLLPDHVVQRAGGHAGHDMRDKAVEYLGGQPAGLAHAGKTLRSVQLDRAGAGLRGGVFYGHIICHAAYIIIAPRFGETPKFHGFSLDINQVALCAQLGK